LSSAEISSAYPQQQHRKTPPRNGVSCFPDADPSVKTSLPDWAATNYRFTGPLRPCLYSPQQTALLDNPAIRKPDYATHPSGVSVSEQRDRSSHASIPMYTDAQLGDADDPTSLRHANRMGRQVLDIAASALRVGVTTDEIDRVLHDACIERNLYPSPLNYYNFPKSLCTSANEVICHGIPDYREVESGDIVNLDVSVYNTGGYHSDLNETYCVGDVDAAGRQLVETSFECLAAAMNLVKPGTLYRDLGAVIERTAKAQGFSVVRTYCGHGVGRLFHTTPNIPHYAKNKAKGVMKAGHVFTIEPMINMGSSADVTWGDNWTAVTADGKRSSQFEHTILVTPTGYEILTARENEPVMQWNAQLNQR
jgi:methionyl aminopeptidase